MAQQIQSVMTTNPVALPDTATAMEAAKMMRERNIGDVIVTHNGDVCGILTDRDIVVRAIAEGRNPSQIKLGELCSREMVTVAPDDSVETAIEIMRDKAVRRLPVIEGGKPVGIVSLGDLAIERDRTSVLGQISAAPANH
jgi:CBS domain-containing protein